MLDFRVAYMLLKPDMVFATNVTNAIGVKYFWAQVKFSRINPKYKTKYQKAEPAFIFLITLLISGDQCWR